MAIVCKNKNTEDVWFIINMEHLSDCPESSFPLRSYVPDLDQVALWYSLIIELGLLTVWSSRCSPSVHVDSSFPPPKNIRVGELVTLNSLWVGMGLGHIHSIPAWHPVFCGKLSGSTASLTRVKECFNLATVSNLIDFGILSVLDFEIKADGFYVWFSVRFSN